MSPADDPLSAIYHGMLIPHDWAFLGRAVASDDDIFRCFRCGRKAVIRGIVARYQTGDFSEAEIAQLGPPCLREDGAEWIGFGWMLPVQA